MSAIDGDVMALVQELRGELGARGVHAELANMSEAVSPIADLYGDGQPRARRGRRRPDSAVAEVGSATVAHVRHLQEMLDFLGRLVLAALGRGRRPRTSRSKEVASIIERAGADAMPILFAVLFVVGFIFTYSTADEFIRLGQRLLSAQLVGRAMAREVAPVMAGFIVAGRSGAAFTAELGLMRIDHEMDALRTLGLEPFGWLVVPRTLALVIVMPALVVVGDLFGCAGGALVGVTTLGLRLPVYVQALRHDVSAWDLESGLIKSVVFGAAIALVGCQRGFSASGGPEDVGRRTTSTVVTCVFLIVLLDAIFTVVYRSFGG